ncbi:MAG: hypothetical protein PHR96_05075, partial [Clostridia bacterium]|nr:hypothetical protein [Clostridia bacterium]
KGGLDLPLDQVYEAADLVKQVVDPSCNIIFGAGIDEASMNDEVEITIIATGFNGPSILEEKEDLTKVKEDMETFNNFNAKSLFGGLAFKNQPEAVKKEKVNISDVENTSRLKIDDADIPPFLKKLRKDRF